MCKFNVFAIFEERVFLATKYPKKNIMKGNKIHLYQIETKQSHFVDFFFRFWSTYIIEYFNRTVMFVIN